MSIFSSKKKVKEIKKTIPGFKSGDKEINIYKEDFNVLIVCYPKGLNKFPIHIYHLFDKVYSLFTGCNEEINGIERITISELNFRAKYTFYFPRDFEYISDVCHNLPKKDYNIIYNDFAINKPQKAANKYIILNKYRIDKKNVEFKNFEKNVSQFLEYEKIILFGLQKEFGISFDTIEINHEQIEKAILDEAESLKKEILEEEIKILCSKSLTKEVIDKIEMIFSKGNIDLNNSGNFFENLLNQEIKVDFKTYEKFIIFLSKRKVQLGNCINNEIKMLNNYLINGTTKFYFNDECFEIVNPKINLENLNSSIKKVSKKKLITVLVTAYNAEKFIIDTLKSIFENNILIKAIVINDNSNDCTKEVVEKFIAENNELDIELLNLEENVGPGIARNIGLKKVDTEYLMILDADDELFCNALDELYYEMIKNVSEITIFNHVYVNNTKKTIVNNKYKYNKQGIYIENETAKFYQNNTYAWGKLYVTKLIKENAINFSEGIYYEDIEFVLKALTHANRVTYIDKCYLKCNIFETSATRTNFENSFHINSYKEALKRIKDYGLKGSVSNKIKLLDALEKKIEIYAQKDIIENYEKNLKILSLEFMKLRQSLIGDYYIPKALFLITKNTFTQFMSMDKLDAELKKTAMHKEIPSKYKIVKYFEKFGFSKDFLVYFGFDFTYRGNSKYSFYEKLLENNLENIYFVTRSKDIPNFCRVSPYTLEFYYIISRAKTIFLESYVDLNHYFPTNTNVIQFWHGIQMKKLGFDSPEEYILRRNPNARSKATQFNQFTKVYSQNEFHEKVMKSSFGILAEKFERSLYPRVEYLVKNKKNSVLKEYIKSKLGINDEKTILYAPSWRDKWIEENDVSMIIDFEKIQIPSGYKVIFSPHPYIKPGIKEISNDKVIIARNIEMQDLILVSDICITDYSSIIFDFIEMDKPIYLYWKDFDEYNLYRGVYDEIVSDFEESTFMDEVSLFENVYNNKEVIKYPKYKYQKWFLGTLLKLNKWKKTNYEKSSK
ncbi:MAG: bifunctional glycosyltransferase/CDP-glycerol:glycerophosphate glycerophosphotransferase [Mycoplasmatales bacterium]